MKILQKGWRGRRGGKALPDVHKESLHLYLDTLIIPMFVSVVVYRKSDISYLSVSVRVQAVNTDR